MHTEPLRAGSQSIRPGSTPGRSRIHATCRVAALTLVVLCSAVAAQAQSEILAWWKRDLLPVRLEVGDWATYALEELGDSKALRDTIRVQVVGSEDSLRWLEFQTQGRPEREYFLVDPSKFGPEQDILGGVLRLVRHLPPDHWVDEDLDEYRNDRLVRRNLEDPFDEPDILREALPDTVFAGTEIARQRVVLSESHEERRNLGSSELVITTELRAVAETSSDTPLLGILRSYSRTFTSYRTEPDRGRSPSPPQELIRKLECIGFGADEAVEMPSFGGF